MSFLTDYFNIESDKTETVIEVLKKGTLTLGNN